MKYKAFLKLCKVISTEMWLRVISYKECKKLGIPYYKHGVHYAKSVRIVHVKAHIRRYPSKQYKHKSVGSQCKRQHGGAVSWMTGLEQYK